MSFPARGKYTSKRIAALAIPCKRMIEIIRGRLMLAVDLPDDVYYRGASYDFDRDAYLLRLGSSRFPQVSEGAVVPYLEKHFVDIITDPKSVLTAEIKKPTDEEINEVVRRYADHCGWTEGEDVDQAREIVRAVFNLWLDIQRENLK